MDQKNESIRNKHWLRLFPPSVQANEDAAKFLVRAIYLGFSSALRFRHALPDECFESRMLSENVKAIILSSKDSRATKISGKIKPLRGAIQAGVLEEVALVFYEDPDNDAEVFEVYKFIIGYTNGNPVMELSGGTERDDDQDVMSRLMQMSFEGNEHTKDQFLCLLRVLQSLCKKIMQPLKKSPCISIRVKLSSEYELQGFCESETLYNLKEDVQTVTVGNVRTPWNAFIINCSSEYIDDAYDCELALMKINDKLASRMGLANNTQYQTFQEQHNVTPTATLFGSLTMHDSLLNFTKNETRPEDYAPAVGDVFSRISKTDRFL